jgi:hypothetical protein
MSVWATGAGIHPASICELDQSQGRSRQHLDAVAAAPDQAKRDSNVVTPLSRARDRKA